jgi:hypothetical protein
MTSYEDILNELKELRQQVSDLQTTVGEVAMKSGTRIAWQDHVSPAGIKLEGPAAIERTGVLISVFGVMVGPGQLALQALARRDGDNVFVPIDLGKCRVL